jgi:hypothetical protein
MTTKTPTKKIIITGSTEWSAAKKGLMVCDCAKCGGNGKYYYQDRSVGNCYACLGLGMTIEGGAKPNLQSGQREVTQMNWSEAKKEITVWYITRDRVGDITPWKKVFQLDNLTEQGLVLLRQLWTMVSIKSRND